MFDITYEIYTEESSQEGEAWEAGFEYEGITLREAWDFLRWQGGYCEANEHPVIAPRWLSFYCEADYRTGETKNFGLHFPENATPSTRRRIARLFKCYGIK